MAIKWTRKTKDSKSYIKNNKNKEYTYKRKHLRKKLWLWGITAIAFLLVLWCVSVERKARYLPEYSKVNIEEYLTKEKLTDEDYELLFLQTGLARPGVDALRREGRQKELLDLQERLFAHIPIVCRANTIVTREERIAESGETAEYLHIPFGKSSRKNKSENQSTDNCFAIIPYIEDGDILITFNSHALGWRNGHAALVVDAKKRLTLEALVLGSNSAVLSLEHWTSYPSFAVLRLKNATEKERKAIVDFAMEQLVDIPYRLTAGWQRKGDTMAPLTGTHCSHLIWYAYNQFGYDLDSDGGLIVTPRDLYESPLLEVIQTYGMPIVIEE